MKINLRKSDSFRYVFLCSAIVTSVILFAVVSAAAQDQPKPKVIPKCEVADFTFSVQNCIFSGANLVFDILVLNNLKDRDICIYSGYTQSADNQKTRLINLEGNEIIVAFIQMGDRSANSEKGEAQIIKTLPTGTPMKLQLVFKDVSNKTNLIPLLEICFNADFKYYKAQIRNISSVN